MKRLIAYFANGFCIGIAASQGNWLALVGWVVAIVWMALYLSAERDSGRWRDRKKVERNVK